MAVIFQFPELIQPANLLWDDNQWACEEKLTGYRCLFKLLGRNNKLSIYNRKFYGDNLRDITNYFSYLNIKTDISETYIDAVLVSPETENKSYLGEIFQNGPLGAEKLMDLRGKAWMVFVDVLSYKNTDLLNMPYGERRVYLENIYHEIKIPNTYLVDMAGNNKKGFYDWLCINGGKGIILKNKGAGYSNGNSRDFLEVVNLRGAKDNITLRNKDYRELLKIEDVKDTFDFDNFLALKALENLEL